MGGAAVYYRGAWEATFPTRGLAEAYVTLMSRYAGKRWDDYEVMDVI